MQLYFSEGRFTKGIKVKKIILLALVFFSVAVFAQTDEYLFDTKHAERMLKKSERLLKQKNVSIRRLQSSRASLAEQINQALGCIKRQKSNYKKLESTLKIVTIPSIEADDSVETADLKYLKDKQLLVRKRLGTCSLYQLKSKDVFAELAQAIITQTKQQTWKRSSMLLNAVSYPLKTLDEVSVATELESSLSMEIMKYATAFIVCVVVLFFIFRNKKISLFIEHLQLNPSFLFSALSSFIFLASIHCFWKYQINISYGTSDSQILFQWIYLAALYLVTLIYGAWFLSAHPGLRMRRFRFPMLFLLFSFFIGTLSLALYGYPYLAYYISMGILNTLEATMIALVLVVVSRKFAKHLNFRLGKSTEDNQEVENKYSKMEIEFKVLAASLKASILVYWLTFCINIWQLSFSADRLLLKYMHEGFNFLNINIVPLNLVKAGLVFSIITILIRLIAKTMFKALNPILINFSYLVAGLCALYVAGVNLTGIAVVAGALSVGIGIGLRGIVNNFISGLILLIEKPVKRGDRIIVNDVEGYVKNIGLRSTEIQTPTNTDVIVPNEQLITSMVTNYMLDETSSISNIEVGIAYGADVEIAQKVLVDIAKAHPHIVSNKRISPWVCLTSFADSAIVLKLIYTIKHAKFLYRTKGELNEAIYKAFNAKGIEFPFPQQDVYIKEFPEKMDKKDKEE